MAKYKDVKPNSKLMYWCNIGNKCVLANLLDEDVELFMLWSNQRINPDWKASEVKTGWYFKEEFAENLNFFQFP